MSEIPKAIQPIYQCDENQPVLLYEGEMELFEGSQITLGFGSIEFTWLPKIRTKFSIHYERDEQLGFSQILDSNKDISLSFLIPEICTEKLVTKVHVLKKSLQNTTTVINGEILDIALGNGDDLSYVIFHLTNFVDYFAPHAESPNGRTASRLILESIEWRVTIDPISNKLINALKDNSGYAITHMCRLERIDGSSFTSQDAEEILFGLNYFLSFVVGRWVSPALPIGFNSTGQKAWEKWLHYRTGNYRYVNSWFPESNPTGISTAFTGFMKWWRNEDWKESFMLLIYWYVESNNSGVEQGILMTQSACELLAWLVLVQDRKVISDEALEKKLSAGDILRLLFSFLQIPIAMPPIPETSPLFLDELKKMLKADFNNLLDCAGCITAIRNRITHPKKKGKSTTILKYSPQERTEAYNLSIWYLELCLLRLFEYEGFYNNRLYKEKWNGDYDKVPWATKD